MKKLKLAVMCGFLCLLTSNLLGQSNLILNPSFELGIHPRGANAFDSGYVSYWTPGYTRNTTSAPALGATPDLLDYNPISPCNSYGPIPNAYVSSYIDLGSVPQHDKRCALIGGGYTGQYADFEGESILGELHKFSCPGDYKLSFWAKAPDGYWQGNCSPPGFFGFVPYTIHANNKIQVALRSTSNTSLDRLLYTTPTAIGQGNWVQYTSTVSITASDIATYNRIEFRIDSAGAQGIFKKIAFIDNVGLKYIGATSYPIHIFDRTISCTELLDLDLVNTKICDGYFDSWTLNDTPVGHIVNPKVNSTYITTCRTCDGCINYKVQVEVTVTNPEVDTIDMFLCYDNRDMLPPSRCPQTNVSSVDWKDPSGNITSSLNPDGAFTAQGPGVYEVTTNYKNGCACKTVINVDMSYLYPIDIVYDTLRCDTCIIIATSICPSGTVKGMWSHSLGTDPVVTVCPRQDEVYEYTCSDSHGCPTQKSQRKITYQNTATTINLTISKVAACGQSEARVPISCNNGVPYTGGTYKWYDQFGNFIVETDKPELPFQAPGQGVYTVEIYDNHGCKICVETFDIIWLDNLKGYFLDGDILKVCPGDCVTLFYDYGGIGILDRYGVTAMDFTWSLPGAPVMGVDIIDNGDGTFTFCPPSLPVTLSRVFVDANNPTCTLYHQQVTILLDPSCGDKAPMMKTLGTNTIHMEPAVVVYPNPNSTSGIFTLKVSGIDLNELSYSIKDVTGKIIVDELKATADKMTINLEQQPKGVYLLNVYYKGSVIIKKLVMQ